MLGNCDIATFIASSDPEKAREFYGDKLGLNFVSEDQFALVFDANGTTLRVQKVKEISPHPYTSLGWHVPEIESAIRDLEKRGVQFERFEGFGQDELGIVTFPNGNKVAWFKDPDGNMLSLDNVGTTE